MKKVLLWILTVFLLWLFTIDTHAEITYTQEVTKSKNDLLEANWIKWKKYQKAIDSFIIQHSKNSLLLSKIFTKFTWMKSKLWEIPVKWTKNYKILTILNYFNNSILQNFAKTPENLIENNTVNIQELSDWSYQKTTEEWVKSAYFTIINWKLEWIFNTYYTNGNIEVKSYYENGLINGEAEIYSLAWELNSIEYYKKGSQISSKNFNLNIDKTNLFYNYDISYIEYFYNQGENTIGHAYNRDDEKIYILPYNKENQLNWLMTTFAPQQVYETEPQIQRSTNFINGIMHWEDLLYWSRTTFNKTGGVENSYVFVKQRWNYKNWKLHWTATFYNMNSAREMTTEYSNWLKDWEEIGYYTLGWEQTDKISVKRLYKNNELISEVSYNTDGSIK